LPVALWICSVCWRRGRWSVSITGLCRRFGSGSRRGRCCVGVFGAGEREVDFFLGEVLGLQEGNPLL